MKIQYPCTLVQLGDGKYHVSFFDFAEACTQGETFQEALMRAEGVLTATLENRIKQGGTIPRPREAAYYGERMITPLPPIQTALLVKFSRGEKTLADLARDLETSWPSVARLEDPSHWCSLKQLAKTSTALGYKLVLSFEKEA